jgi:hypothetical protein
MEHKDLHRLLSAAIVNRSFRTQLLEDPLEAVRVGCCGQTFSLTVQEHHMLASISTADFPAFSYHIHQWISRNGHGGRDGQSSRQASQHWGDARGRSTPHGPLTG